MDARTVIHLAHLLILGPLLIGIGLGYGPKLAIAALGAFIIVYHIYKATQKQNPWVNLIHVFVVGPALVAHGLTDTRWTQEVILMLGFAAVGYHGYYALSSGSS